MIDYGVIFGAKRHFYGGIAPSNLKSFSAIKGDTSISINIEMPDDTVVEGQTLCSVAGVALCRSLDHFPENEFDGFIADIPYQEGIVVYEDRDADISKNYYYSAFPYSDNNVYNRNKINRFKTVNFGTPVSIRFEVESEQVTNQAATVRMVKSSTIYLTLPDNYQELGIDVFYPMYRTDGRYPQVLEDGKTAGVLPQPQKLSDFTIKDNVAELKDVVSPTFITYDKIETIFYYGVVLGNSTTGWVGAGVEEGINGFKLIVEDYALPQPSRQTSLITFGNPLNYTIPESIANENAFSLTSSSPYKVYVMYPGKAPGFTGGYLGVYPDLRTDGVSTGWSIINLNTAGNGVSYNASTRILTIPHSYMKTLMSNISVGYYGYFYLFAIDTREPLKLTPDVWRNSNLKTTVNKTSANPANAVLEQNQFIIMEGVADLYEQIARLEGDIE